MEKTHKITKVSWPGLENIDEYSWIDEEGNIHLRSIEEDICEVVLSANCLHVRVNFLFLLPEKKGKWVVTTDNQGAYDVDDGQSENRSQISRITGQSHRSQHSSRMMKMHYQYVRIEQIHSIAQVPKRWSYPLKMILALKQINPATELAILPIDEIMSIEMEAQEIVRGKEYQTSLPVHISSQLTPLEEQQLLQ